jgi:hypothetical protein
MEGRSPKAWICLTRCWSRGAGENGAESGQKAWQIGRLVVAENLQRLPVCADFWSRFDARSSAGFTLFGKCTDHAAPCNRSRSAAAGIRRRPPTLMDFSFCSAISA